MSNDEYNEAGEAHSMQIDELDATIAAQAAEIERLRRVFAAEQLLRIQDAAEQASLQDELASLRSRLEMAEKERDEARNLAAGMGREAADALDTAQSWYEQLEKAIADRDAARRECDELRSLLNECVAQMDDDDHAKLRTRCMSKIAPAPTENASGI